MAYDFFICAQTDDARGAGGRHDDAARHRLAIITHRHCRHPAI